MSNEKLVKQATTFLNRSNLDHENATAELMAEFAATIVRERDTELARKLRDVNLSYDITQRHRLGDIISELLESGKEQGEKP